MKYNYNIIKCPGYRRRHSGGHMPRWCGTGTCLPLCDGNPVLLCSLLQTHFTDLSAPTAALHQRPVSASHSPKTEQRNNKTQTNFSLYEKLSIVSFNSSLYTRRTVNNRCSCMTCVWLFWIFMLILEYYQVVKNSYIVDSFKIPKLLSPYFPIL